MPPASSSAPMNRPSTKPWSPASAVGRTRGNGRRRPTSNLLPSRWTAGAVITSKSCTGKAPAATTWPCAGSCRIPLSKNRWPPTPLPARGLFRSAAPLISPASLFNPRTSRSLKDVTPCSRFSSPIKGRFPISGRLTATPFPGRNDPSPPSPPPPCPPTTTAAGPVLSAEAVLTVLADTNAPALLGAINLSTTNVLVSFSEPVEEASATNLAHYALSGGITLSAAVLNDPQTVILTTSPLLLGNNYTVTVNDIRDRATAPNVIAANSQAAFTAIDFVPIDIGGPVPAGSTTSVPGGYDVAGGGGDIGGATDQFQFSYQLRSGNFDVQVRVGALTPSDAWAKAGLMARESLAANSRFTATFATPSVGGCFFESRATPGSGATLAGSFPVNFPWTWLRLQRVGNVFTGFASLDGVNWQPLGSASLSLPGTLYFGMAVTCHTPARGAAAQFRNRGGPPGDNTSPAPLPPEPLAACSRRTGLVLSEIMYHPKNRPDSNNLEFIELFNSQAFYEDISGYRLSGDISYTFPSGTVLPAGGFLVVAHAPADVQNVYGLAAVLGPYTNSLPNDTGLVRLRNRQDAVLLEVNYDSRPPWPIAADGAGHSLVLARPSYGEGSVAAWAQSDLIGGSPGRGESFGPEPLRSLRINEFLADSDLPLLDYVELFNAGNLPVDPQGAFLSDKAGTNKFRITNSLVLPARGFAVFDQNQLGFSLDGGGEDLFLVNSNQTRVIDAVRFEGQVTGVASGRYPDGAPVLQELAARSPGTANSPPLIRDIVINEIMYAPVSGDGNDEYVELYNRGTGAVSLASWKLTDRSEERRVGT